MIKHFITKQFLFFLIVGIFAATVNFLTRIILSEWFEFSISVFIAYGFGILIAFTLKAIYVFPGATRSLKIQFRDFFLTNILCFPLVFFGSIYLREVLIYFNYDFYLDSTSHLISLSFPMLFTFLIYKFFVFK